VPKKHVILVANNPKIKTYDRLSLWRLVREADEIVFFNGMVVYEWLAAVTSFNETIEHSIALRFGDDDIILGLTDSSLQPAALLTALCGARRVIGIPDVGFQKDTHWRQLTGMLSTCGKHVELLDHWQSFMPSYPTASEAEFTQIPSSGFWITAWYMLQNYKVTLLGFNTTDYGDNSWEGHNLMFEKQVLNVWADLRLLDRFP